MMRQRLALLLGLVLVLVWATGCSFVGTGAGSSMSARSPCEAIEGAAINAGLKDPSGPLVGANARMPAGAEWGRTSQRVSRFFGTHFFNYNVHDPYRGNDLASMGEFAGTYFLNYDVGDPFRGDCLMGR